MKLRCSAVYWVGKKESTPGPQHRLERVESERSASGKLASTTSHTHPQIFTGFEREFD